MVVGLSYPGLGMLRHFLLEHVELETTTLRMKRKKIVNFFLFYFVVTNNNS